MAALQEVPSLAGEISWCSWLPLTSGCAVESERDIVHVLRTDHTWRHCAVLATAMREDVRACHVDLLLKREAAQMNAARVFAENLEAEASRARVAQRVDMVVLWERKVQAALLIQRHFRAWVSRRRRACVAARATRVPVDFAVSGQGFRSALGPAAASAPSLRARSFSASGSRSRQVPRQHGDSGGLSVEADNGAAGGTCSPPPSTAPQRPMLRSSCATDGEAAAGEAAGRGLPAFHSSLRVSSRRRGSCGDTPRGSSHESATTAAGAGSALVGDTAGSPNMWITAAAVTAPTAPLAHDRSLVAAQSRKRVEWVGTSQVGEMLVSGVGEPPVGPAQPDGAASGSSLQAEGPSTMAEGATASASASQHAPAACLVSGSSSRSRAADFAPRSDAAVEQQGLADLGLPVSALSDAAALPAARLAAVYRSALYAPALEQPRQRRAPQPSMAAAELEAPLALALGHPGTSPPAAPAGCVTDPPAVAATERPGEPPLTLPPALCAQALQHPGGSASGGGPHRPRLADSKAWAPRPAIAPAPDTSLPPIRVTAAPLSPGASSPPAAAGSPSGSGAGAGPGSSGPYMDAGPAFDGAQQLLDRLHLQSPKSPGPHQQPQYRTVGARAPWHGTQPPPAAPRRGLLAAVLSGAAAGRLEELPPLSEATALTGRSLSSSSPLRSGVPAAGAPCAPSAAPALPPPASEPPHDHAPSPKSPCAAAAPRKVAAGRMSPEQPWAHCVQGEMGTGARQHSSPAWGALGLSPPRRAAAGLEPCLRVGGSGSRSGSHTPGAGLQAPHGLGPVPVGAPAVPRVARPTLRVPDDGAPVPCASSAPATPLGWATMPCPDPTASFDVSVSPGGSEGGSRSSVSVTRPVPSAASWTAAGAAREVAHRALTEALRERGARSSLDVHAPPQLQLGRAALRSERFVQCCPAALGEDLVISPCSPEGGAVGAGQHRRRCVSSLGLAPGSSPVRRDAGIGFGGRMLGDGVSGAMGNETGSPRSAWAGKSAGAA